MKSKSRQYAHAGIYTRLLICILTVSMLMSVFPFFVSGAETQEKMPSGISRSEVESTIKSCWDEHEGTAAGMAVSVFDKNGIIYTDTFGYADKEKNIPLEEDSVLDWGSVTKTLIWVSAMQLKEQGKLDLNRDIRDYLPEGFLTHLSFDTPITMLHLMNHTAGFDQILYEMETPDKDEIISLGDYLKKYQPTQSFEPGTTVAYSNWGAALAGYIIECISGEPFSDYVHKNIFEPLGMNNTALKADLSDNPQVAEKRRELQGYTREGYSAGDCYRYIILYPAGMCTSDINDFTTYARALAAPETKLFKNKETYQEMITTTTYIGDSDIPSNCHGFWRSMFGDNVAGHSGNTSSCTSELDFDITTGTGMVVMTNQIGESQFCSGMVKSIMGEPSADRHDGVNGNIISLPAIMTGPFKFMSVVSVAEVTEEMFAESDYAYVRQTTDKVDKLSTAGMDFLVVSDGDMAAMYIPIALWSAALIFALIGLAVKLIRLIVRKIKKNDNIIPLGKWSTVSSLLIVFSILLLYICVQSFSDTAMWSIDAYRIWSVCYLVLALGAAVAAVIGCIRIFKESMTVKRRIYNCVAVLMTAAVIYNIVYWQLYAFWLV